MPTWFANLFLFLGIPFILCKLNQLILNSINTVQELIQQLSESSKDNYNFVLQNLGIERQSLSKYEHWSKANYLRNGIYKDERFEIIL